MGSTCMKFVSNPLSSSVHPISTIGGQGGLYGWTDGEGRDGPADGRPRQAWAHNYKNIDNAQKFGLDSSAEEKLYAFLEGKTRVFHIPKQNDDGPACWGKSFPLAAGPKQSPVDIVRAQVQPDPVLLERPLKLNYEDVATKCIVNGGYGWRVDVASKNHNLEGGPLNHRYRVVQFHSHWGETCCDGSEHTVDGEAFSGELHLVHYNIDLYDEPGKAASSENGLAVVGIFFKEGNPHPEFEKLCKLLSCIKHKGCKCEDIASPFDISAFLPNDAGKYWTYEGSLTTPPCYESVSWIVLKEPIQVSKDQLNAFRSLLTYEANEKEVTAADGPVIKNWRNCQPLQGRVIREPPSK